MMAQPAPAPRPSGVTAIFAAVLALVVGSWYLVVGGLVWLSWYGSIGLFLTEGAYILAGVSLVLGGILLLTRRPAGRLLCAFGAVLALAYRAISAGVYVGMSGPEPFPSGALALSWIVWSLPAIAILVLVLLPATRRWAQRPAPAPPPSSYPYPPGTHPEYPQQHQQGGRPQGW